MVINKYLLTGCCFFITFMLSSIANAQSTGTIQGKITKQANKDPVQYVNVILKQKGSGGKAKGTTTNAKGRFIIQDIKWGTYDLILSYVGYHNKTLKALELSPANPVIKLDTLTMKQTSENLEGVSIQAERDFMTQTPEGLTINPSKNITQTGGSAIDILQNTPTVSVTYDGGIKMRGTEAGATQVLINGRQSALSDNIAQIPASAIEKIEVIHNPGAKYQAEGKGGVINIVLKKQTQKGTNGKVQLSGGSRNRYNTSLQLNHGTENFNHFLNFNRRYDVDLEDAWSRRDVYDGDTTISRIEEGNETEYETSNTIRAGTQYFWNYFNELGVDVLYENEDEDNLSEMQNDRKLIQPTENLIERRKITTESQEQGYTYEPTIYYKRDFAEKGRQLKTSLKYSYEHQKSEETTEKRPLVNPNSQQFREYENRQVTKENRNLAIFRADYTDPVFNNGNLEAGIRSQYRKFDNDYDYFEFNRQDAEWENLDYISNRFIYEEQVHAAYLQYSHTMQKWTLMGGIRGEQTYINTQLANEDAKNEDQYLDLFPSGRIQYKIDKKQSLSLSYTKRIDRPSAWRLNPFPDLSDSSSIFIGNPNVDPEYIHSFELTHGKEWNKFNLYTTAFYRERKGVIDYLTVIRDGIPYIRPQNLAKGTTYGAEITTSIKATDFWEINLNGSVYNRIIEGTIEEFEGVEAGGEEISNEDVTWRAQMNTTFILPFDFKLQLTGNFDGPEVEALEKEKAQYYFNAGLQKPLFDGKGSIGANIQDVLDTREMEEIGRTEDFFENRIHQRQSRVFMVSFEYEI